MPSVVLGLDTASNGPAYAKVLTPETSGVNSVLQSAITQSMSKAANVMCAKVDPHCPCGFIFANEPEPGCYKTGGPEVNNFMCPPGSCKDLVAGGAGGVVLGQCTAPGICTGVQAFDASGHAMALGNQKSSGLGSLFDGIGAKDIIGALPSLMGMMGGGGKKGGDSGGGNTSPIDSSLYNSGTCTSAYYAVSTPSTDPCAYYTGANNTTNNALGNSSDYLAQLLGGSGDMATTSVSDSLLSNYGDSPLFDYNGETTPASNVSDDLLALPDASGDSGLPGVQVGAGEVATSGAAVLTPNIQTTGSILSTQHGATIIANSRDVNANVEVAGFYGGDTISNAGGGVIGTLCRWRPWDNAVVSFFVPPSFFDSLCAKGGYQVGQPVAQAKPKTQAIIVQPTATSGPVFTAPPGTPETTIWASPPRVSLGGRTSVFWESRNVDSCHVTSSDGSFDENSPSGGASTVPITASTDFTILCQVSDGTTVTDTTTVGLTL